MHKKVTVIIGVIFFILGAGLLVGAVIAGQGHSRFAANADPVTATILHITGGENPRPTIEYYAHGQHIERQINWYSTGMHVGGAVEILVSRDNPHDVRAAGFIGWILPFVLGGIGGVFFLVGAVLLISARRRRGLHKYLLENGTPVWANVRGVEANHSVRVNGVPAKMLVATYKNMRFVSGTVDNNDLINLGEHVKILMHPDNANKYTFDLKNESHLEPLEPPAPLAEGNNSAVMGMDMHNQDTFGSGGPYMNRW